LADTLIFGVWHSDFLEVGTTTRRRRRWQLLWLGERSLRENPA